jgi:replicative DNA helicase
MDNQNSSRKTNRKTANTEDYDNFGGKIPPQAIELEEAVLGALMLEKNALNEVIDLLRPEVFYKESHKSIYEAIRQLFDKFEPIDIRTVVHQLRKMGELDLAGGTGAVAALTRNVASAANIVYHTRILIEQTIKRELIKLAGEIPPRPNGASPFQNFGVDHSQKLHGFALCYANGNQRVRK